MGEPADPTARYAAALRRLHEAAGSPSGGAIELQAAAQRPPRKITPQSWSDWRNGRNVPSDRAVAAFLIGYLRSLARRRNAGQGVPSDQWWESTRRAALAERRSGPGQGGRPAQRHPTVFPGLVRETTLRIGRETVSYGHAGEVPLAEHPPREVDHGLEGLLWRLAHARERGAGDTVVPVDALVRETSRKLGSIFLDGPAGEALAADLATTARERSVLRLGVEVAEDLFDLPWEALILPGQALPLTLTPGVEVYRLVPGPATAHKATAAPLRILAVVASPDGQDGAALLDLELELRAILDAVEPAKRHAAAYVRVLNEGTLASIHEALRQERYHVLHISCHAQPGLLALEDKSGRVDTVSAARLAEAVPRGGEVPLIVLSGCSTALGGEVITGLAQGLTGAGMPMVLAMTASVSDQ